MVAFRKQFGFTLLELVFVLILMSILSVGIYLKWPGSIINLGGQAYQLADDLRYTQTLSMTTGQRYRLVKTSANTYQIVNFAGTAIKLAMGNTSVTLNSGITFGTLTNLPNSLVEFDGLGGPYTTATVPGTALTSIATIPLTAGSDTVTVNITPETGRVFVQ